MKTDVCATSFELNSSNIYRWIPRFQFRSWCNCFQPRNLLYIYRSLFLANKYIGTTAIYLKLSPILSSYFFLKLPLREVCCFKSKSKLCLLSTISLKREKPPINSLIHINFVQSGDTRSHNTITEKEFSTLIYV